MERRQLNEAPPSPDDMAKAEREGRRANTAGKSNASCPYPWGSTLHEHWALGWHRANRKE